MQTAHLHRTLEYFSASRHYYPGCLLVHPDVRHLQTLVADIRTWFNWSTLSLGTILSAALLAVPPSHRSRSTQSLLTESVRPCAPGPLLCRDIDLLFEPSLNLNPLQLLQKLSRVTALVVLWPGNADMKHLWYAAPSHPHYRSWSRTELPAESVIAV